MVHATDTPTVLLGLDGFVLLAATEHDHELVLLVETAADRDWCRVCGVRAGSKGRARGHRPRRPGRRPPGDAGVEETGLALRAAGVSSRFVAGDERADPPGVGWHTVNDAVLDIGTQMIDGDDRLDEVRAVGVDEHNVLRGTFNCPTTWGTAFVDLDSGRLLDVVENRTAAAVRAWFTERGDDWCRGIEQAALDPYEGYAIALRRALPDATLVVDHFHLIRVRREAPCVRGRVRDPTRWSVAAGRLKLEAA